VNNGNERTITLAVGLKEMGTNL